MAGEVEQVRRLAEPLAKTADVELVDIEVKGSGSRRMVRLVVDRQGGVDLATCEDLSRTLSARLDEEDPVAGRYTLEVTSPGTDRPLSDQRSFERVRDRRVLVHRDAGDGRVLQVEGTVVAADGDAVLLEVDGEHTRIPYDEITKATQRLPW